MLHNQTGVEESDRSKGEDMKIRIEPNFTDGRLMLVEDGLIIEGIGEVLGIELEVALKINEKTLPDLVRIIEEGLAKKTKT